MVTPGPPLCCGLGLLRLPNVTGRFGCQGRNEKPKLATRTGWDSFMTRGHKLSGWINVLRLVAAPFVPSKLLRSDLKLPAVSKSFHCWKPPFLIHCCSPCVETPLAQITWLPPDTCVHEPTGFQTALLSNIWLVQLHDFGRSSTRRREHESVTYSPRRRDVVEITRPFLKSSPLCSDGAASLPFMSDQITRRLHKALNAASDSG